MSSARALHGASPGSHRREQRRALSQERLLGGDPTPLSWRRLCSWLQAGGSSALLYSPRLVKSEGPPFLSGHLLKAHESSKFPKEAWKDWKHKFNTMRALGRVPTKHLRSPKRAQTSFRDTAYDKGSVIWVPVTSTRWTFTVSGKGPGPCGWRHRWT